MNSTAAVEEHGIEALGRKVELDQTPLAMSVKELTVCLINCVALSSYHPNIQKKVDTLIKQLKERDSKTINVTQWTQYYTFDVMGEIAFKKDFGQLEDGAEHYAITAMHAQLEQIGLLGAVPWVLHLLVRIPGLGGPYAIFNKYCIEQVENRKKVWRT